MYQITVLFEQEYQSHIQLCHLSHGKEDATWSENPKRKFEGESGAAQKDNDLLQAASQLIHHEDDLEKAKTDSVEGLLHNRIGGYRSRCSLSEPATCS